MDKASIEQRIRDRVQTSQTEALRVLEELLRDAERAPAGEQPERLGEAAVLSYSLLRRSDESQTPIQDLVSELEADGKRAPELCELLRRLLDQSAPDALRNPAEAQQLLHEIETAVRRDQERREREAQARQPAPEPVPTIEAEQQLRRNRKLAGLGCAVLALVLVALLVIKVTRQTREHQAPSYDLLVEGTLHEVWDAATLDQRRMDPTWAREVHDASTRYDKAEGALQWADAYDDPEPDDIRTWRAKWPDQGTEYLSLCFSQTRTRAIVVVEAANAGALVAIDDLPDAQSNTLGVGRRERLWQGRLEPLAGSRINVFRLAEPRYIRCLRLVLDTSLVPGDNRVDAVGLLSE